MQDCLVRLPLHSHLWRQARSCAHPDSETEWCRSRLAILIRLPGRHSALPQARHREGCGCSPQGGGHAPAARMPRAYRLAGSCTRYPAQRRPRFWAAKRIAWRHLASLMLLCAAVRRRELSLQWCHSTSAILLGANFWHHGRLCMYVPVYACLQNSGRGTCKVRQAERLRLFRARADDF